jgi:uncharacterized protein YraI
MTRSTSFAAALSLAASIVLAGCGAAPSEPSASDVAVSASELSTTGPTYAAGTVLRTTTDLNLRSAANTGASVLRVMPAGSAVTVRSASGGNAWVAVTFNGYAGWAHTDYLAVVSTPSSGGSAPSASPGGYSASRGATLARTALRRDGYPAGGYCALQVSNSVEQSGIIPRGVTWYRNNAIDIGEYMNANPSYGARVGFKRGDTSPSSIRKGSIIVWRRGQCGYHSTYGHIEIAVDDSSSRACSDFCGSIRKTCGNPYVYYPTTL